MNNIKKLHKGMSLVEVLVAMTVFSVGTAAVTMAFATAVKYNTHNQRRDDELAIQMEAVQNGRNEGLELYKGAGSDFKLRYTVNGSEISYVDQYNNPVSPNPYAGVTEYQASKSGKNDTIFDFQLKSFSNTVAGEELLVYSKTEDKYRIRIVNESPQNYDVRVYINGGTIYQGDLDGNGYKHSSNLFCRSLAPQTTDYTLTDENGDPVQKLPSVVEFGYKYDNLDTVSQMDSPMYIQFYKDGFVYRDYTLKVADITSCATGSCVLTIKPDGSIPVAYPN